MFRSILLFLSLCVVIARAQEYPQGHDVSFYFWTCSLSGRLQNGRCCDQSGYTNCPDHCDVHFFVCIREHNETSNYCNENTTSHFTFFRYAYLDVHNITFFEGENVFGAGLHNPLVYPFSGNWSKRIQTVLVARDYDYSDWTGTYDFEWIDYIDVNWTIPAGRAVDRRSYDGVYRNMVVQVGLKVDCWKAWYGDYCTKYCVPRDNSTGHYLCNESGEKECLFGWGGVHCLTGKCSPACPTGSSCNNSTRECSCDYGYAEVGMACECIPHKDCNLIGGYCQLPDECTCRKGFSGTDCDFVNFCKYRGNPCHNGGACVSTGNNTYSCQCPIGYQGLHCSFMACPNTGCSSLLPCGNHGMCTNTSSGVHCMCKKGFVGRCCETQVDYCLANPCAHGNCTNMVGDYSCSCDAGYKGKDCDVPIDECALHDPCENGGTCHDRIAGYSCVCANGYSGVNCSVSCSMSTLCDCADSCVHGSCVTTGGPYSCVCLAGYTGRSCDSDIDDCDGACYNGANCTDGVNSFICHCTGGYSGDTCATDIDECLFDPCDHGNCSNTAGSYACHCEAAYTGDTCDTFQQIDYCTLLDPCLNGGTCHNEPFGRRCECASGYNGTECEEEIDRCEGIVCHNSGACQEGVCVCTVSYSGPACTHSVDVCEENVPPDDCYGNCINDTSEPTGYRCECHSGYTGDTCHEDIEDCRPGSCGNRGNCTDGLNQFFCDCETGYIGERCETPVDTCETNLCLNGGVCVAEGAGYRCECPEGYVAPICEKTEECNRHSCNDKGECKGIGKELSEALCDCDAGYTGQFCETLIDYCASSPCHNGATCYKGVASYYCRCENNVTDCVESGEPSGSQLIPGIDNSLTGVGSGAALGVILTLLVVLILIMLLLALKYKGKKNRRERQETPRGRGQRNQLLDSQDSTFINPFFDGTESYPMAEPPSYDTVQYSHYKVYPSVYPAVPPSPSKEKEGAYANPSLVYPPEKEEAYANPSLVYPPEKVPLQ